METRNDSGKTCEQKSCRAEISARDSKVCSWTQNEPVSCHLSQQHRICLSVSSCAEKNMLLCAFVLWLCGVAYRSNGQHTRRGRDVT